MVPLQEPCLAADVMFARSGDDSLLSAYCGLGAGILPPGTPPVPEDARLHLLRCAPQCRCTCRGSAGSPALVQRLESVKNRG